MVNVRLKRITKFKSHVLIALFSALMVTGCARNDYSDLNAYIEKINSRPAGRIEPVPEFKTYETYEYMASNMREPFKMFDSTADIVEKETVTDGLRPDMDRNKETLEQYPLDTLKFVGHVEKNGRKWAIVTSPDDLVHRVKEGNHLGTNYGEIVNISETTISIVEIIQDGMGGWIEREAALTMSE